MFKQISLALGVSAALMIGGTAFAAKGDAPGGLALRGQHVSGATSAPSGVLMYFLDVDVSGMQTHQECEFGAITAGNDTLQVNLGPGAFIAGVAGAGSITATSPSWLSEIAVQFHGEDPDEDVQLTLSDTDASGTEAYDIDPPLMLGDFSIPDITVGATGIATLEFCEGFNDSSVDPDGTFAAGSVITVIYYGGNPPGPGPAAPIVATVPASNPWTLGLLAGALGLLGFGLMRRRG